MGRPIGKQPLPITAILTDKTYQMKYQTYNIFVVVVPIFFSDCPIRAEKPRSGRVWPGVDLGLRRLLLGIGETQTSHSTYKQQTQSWYIWYFIWCDLGAIYRAIDAQPKGSMVAQKPVYGSSHRPSHGPSPGFSTRPWDSPWIVSNRGGARNCVRHIGSSRAGPTPHLTATGTRVHTTLEHHPQHLVCVTCFAQKRCLWRNTRVWGHVGSHRVNFLPFRVISASLFRNHDDDLRFWLRDRICHEVPPDRPLYASKIATR